MKFDANEALVFTSTSCETLANNFFFLTCSFITYKSGVKMLMKTQVILKESVAKSRFVFRDEKPLPMSDLSQITYRAKLFDIYKIHS